MREWLESSRHDGGQSLGTSEQLAQLDELVAQSTNWKAAGVSISTMRTTDFAIGTWGGTPVEHSFYDLLASERA